MKKVSVFQSHDKSTKWRIFIQWILLTCNQVGYGPRWSHLDTERHQGGRRQFQAPRDMQETRSFVEDPSQAPIHLGSDGHRGDKLQLLGKDQIHNCCRCCERQWFYLRTKTCPNRKLVAATTGWGEGREDQSFDYYDLLPSSYPSFVVLQEPR